MDTASKISAGFVALNGVVQSYDSSTKIYKVRASIPGYSLLSCYQLTSPGFDAPYSIGDHVAIHRYPPSGQWVIAGKLLIPRDTGTRADPSMPDAPAPKLTQVSHRDPNDRETLFHAEPGEFQIGYGSSPARFVISKLGVLAAKVSEFCSFMMGPVSDSAPDSSPAGLESTGSASNGFIFNFLRGVLRWPRAIINIGTPSAPAAEPTATIKLVPQTVGHDIRLTAGGKVTADDKADGIELTMGSLVKLVLSLLPTGATLVYTQDTAKISISTSEFLQQFGDGTAKWTAAGLEIVKGASKITVAPASLELAATSLKLTVEAALAVQAGSVTMDAATIDLQKYRWLTVVNRLNALIIDFIGHTHPVNLVSATALVQAPPPIDATAIPPILGPVIPQG